ncbi:SDR family oxidoreductase [Streptococcus sp. 20-1249]|uniref:SDR family oxidoreductase n=1 Tax=Streptococcus hepaticus TaxID=3349163 RepID=UPI00374A28C5
MIAITGVTGNLGSFVAEKLAQVGITSRHLARSPERAKKYESAQLVRAAYENSEESRQALAGVDILFMVSGKEHPNRLQQHLDFIDAAKAAGVHHIIYTSFYNASETATFTLSRDHAKTENYIKEQGFTYTFLRDNFYMDFFVELCLAYDEIRGPAGNGKVSAVLRQDVAQVIVEILKNPSQWENQILDMTGPENLTMQEIVDLMASKLGRNIAYIRETVEEAYESRKVWPAEAWEYDSWVSTYTAISVGEQEGVSSDIERVLGCPATSLSEYVKTLD